MYKLLVEPTSDLSVVRWDTTVLNNFHECFEYVLDGLGLAGPLILELVDEVPHGDDEGAEQRLVEPLEDVIVHRAQKAGLEQLVVREGYLELNEGVDGGVSTWGVRLCLDVRNGPSIIGRD